MSRACPKPEPRRLYYQYTTTFFIVHGWILVSVVPDIHINVY